MNAQITFEQVLNDDMQTGELLMVVPDEEAANELTEFLSKDSSAKIQDISAVHSLEIAKLHASKLHEASLFEKTNIRSAMVRGCILGLILALGTSLFLSLQSEFGHSFLSLGTLALTTIFVLLGLWVSTLIGISEPSKKLERFVNYIDRGNVLLIVKAPKKLISYIRSVSKYALGGRLLADRSTSSGDKQSK